MGLFSLAARSLLINRVYTHNGGSECKRLWVLKKGCSEGLLVGCEHRSEEEFSASGRLSRCGERRLRPLAEEADQSLDVLGSCRQEELLPNKL